MVVLLFSLWTGLASTSQIFRSLQSSPGSCDWNRHDWCNYEHGSEDDFDWQLRTEGKDSAYVYIDTTKHDGQNQHSRLFTPFINHKDTHCISFDYKLTGHGQLSVYVIKEYFVYNHPVWSTQSITPEWTTVQLALTPQAYKLVFEGRILSVSDGLIALDNVNVQQTACSQAPHFLRLGDVKVNEGETAEVQCIAHGRSTWGTAIKLQKWNNAEEETVSRSHNMVDYQSARFVWEAIGQADADQIRCVASNATAAGVSNYANLVVKRPPRPVRAPEVETAGPTYLIVRLNVDKDDPTTYTGDGPITKIDFRYRKLESQWEDGHDVPLNNNGTYRIWHLEPDTRYTLCVVLQRPHKGGTGKSGPCLDVRTKCAKPQPLTKISVDPYKGQLASDSSDSVYADNLIVRWMKPTEKAAGCRKYSYSLRWREVGGIWKTKEPEKENSIISNLRADTQYEVQVTVRNMAGSADSPVVRTKTNDGLPEPIPSWNINVITTEKSIIVQWPYPAVPNGDIISYKLSYQFWSSYDKRLSSATHNSPPFKGSFEIDAHNRQVHTIDNLPAGTTYNLTLSAKTSAGYGRATELVGTTKIGRPRFKNAIEPEKFEDNDPIIIKLEPAEGNGAPVSYYNVVVENADNRRRRRAQSSCFYSPLTYEEMKSQGEDFYFAAQIDQSTFETPGEYNFKVGDNATYQGFRNAPLAPGQKVKVWFQAVSLQPGCQTSGRTVVCDKNIQCNIVATRGVDPPPTLEPELDTLSPEQIGMTTTEALSSVPSSGSVLLYGGISIGLLLILFLFVGSVVCLRRRAIIGGRERYPVTNPDFMNRNEGVMYTEDPKKTLGYPSEKTPLMPDVVDYPTINSGKNSEAEDFAVRVEDFPIHVSQMRSSRTYSFQDEFETLPEGGTAAWEVAMKPENLQKNRYNNILPYDHSRVVLRSSSQIVSSGDYINASWIAGYGLRYIAAQGPTEQTIQDFWHCIWQENIRLIVMVTGLVEVGRRKCHQYWPKQIRGIEKFGSFQIELVSEQSVAHYTLREIKIKLNGYDARTIRQMQFLSWPDHGVPARATSLLQFVRRSAQLNPDNQPVLVHCSAGSGRSGCFIVLDWMLRMADSEGLLDIYNTVKELRSRRVNMVANLEQYIFLHEALLEAVLCGETGVTSLDLTRHYDQLITVSNGSAPIQEEFETLTVLTPRLTTEECQTARLARNRPKNRFMDVLPADRDLPYLITPDPAGSDPSNNYINAVFADSFITRRDLILTQMPLPHTCGDFWRLVHDYNVSAIIMLNDPSENDESVAQYWPDSGQQTYGAFTIECLSKDDEIELVSRTLKLTNYYRESDPARLVKQLQLTNWPAGQPVPSSRNSVLRLATLIEQWRKQQPDVSRVLVHCVAGAGRSGTFAGCMCVIQQLLAIQSADVFSAVLQLRAVRPQLVETLDQYRFIYEVAMEFADSQNL